MYKKKGKSGLYIAIYFVSYELSVRNFSFQQHSSSQLRSGV